MAEIKADIAAAIRKNLQQPLASEPSNALITAPRRNPVQGSPISRTLGFNSFSNPKSVGYQNAIVLLSILNVELPCHLSVAVQDCSSAVHALELSPH
jgi:hypothetical protein